MRINAIIVAGGQGARMGSAMPKQFLELQGKPILYHTLKAFLDTFPEIHIIVVLPKAFISYANMVLQHFDSVPEITLVAGGNTRYESVQNGIKALTDDTGITFVHDGVRPLISRQLLQKCYQVASEKGSAIPAVAVVDSMRMFTGDNHQQIDRNQLRSVQTPQTFQTQLLKRAFLQPYQESFTDEANVIEATGEKVILVDGERSNIKITTPEDLAIAEALLAFAAQKEK